MDEEYAKEASIESGFWAESIHSRTYRVPTKALKSLLFFGSFCPKKNENKMFVHSR
jgi:hypothetical protein